MAPNDMVEAHGLRPEDFDSIREAVMETPRGRWFLNEYAARLRSSETQGLLDSMKRLENAVASNHDALMTRLASALAREIGTSAPAATPPADLAPRHMKFFKQDEEIFEPAPQARISAVPAEPKPEPKPEMPRGARVVIRHAEQASVTVELPKPEAEAAASPAAQPTAPQAAAEPQPAPQADAAPKRRIVIIRHKPGEDIDVPMQKEMAEAS